MQHLDPAAIVHPNLRLPFGELGHAFLGHFRRGAPGIHLGIPVVGTDLREKALRFGGVPEPGNEYIAWIPVHEDTAEIEDEVFNHSPS